MTNLFTEQRFIGIYALTLLGGLWSLSAHADVAKYQLNVSPEQCVALRQGQQCYVDVIVTWQANAIGDYCLHASSQVKPLQCWQQQQSAKFSQELVARQDITFTLKRINSANVLAQGLITMAWVYDNTSRKNTSWRMF